VHQCISSTLVREVASLGGDVAQFVSPSVFSYMQAHLRAKA
jgi:pantetheine-phosphate adenylyltransferase